MWAIVTVSLLGSPPHLWNDVLGEGSSSLNHPLSHAVLFIRATVF